MITTADVDTSARVRLGGMALEAEVRIAHRQHLVVHRPVRIVATRAAVAHGFVFEDEGAGLGIVTLQTGLVGAL